MRHLFNKVFILCFLFVTFVPVAGWADSTPPTLADLQKVEGEDDVDVTIDFSEEFRSDSQKEAALSYGARGGLSARTYEIRHRLKSHEDLLDQVFNFNRLLLKAPSGLLMEPPIIDESLNALVVNEQGQEAAVTDRIYQIDQPAKIVTAPRNWRTYLEREWDSVPPPPSVLLPQDAKERRKWRDWVAKGWAEGYAQAEEIFQTDLDRLTADFNGMIRYRLLLAQGMVSAPYALHEDRGVTGGGEELRVGDRAIRITGPSQLKAGVDQWQPANR